MDSPPLVVALARARESRVTGALILRRPGGEGYTVTLYEGTPVQVEPGPDIVPDGGRLLLLDQVRRSVLAEDLDPSATPADQAAQVARRLMRILRLTGECELDPSIPVAARGPAELAELDAPPSRPRPVELRRRTPQAAALVAPPSSAPPPPSARARISVAMPVAARATESYAGPRVSIPFDLPPRAARTPVPASLRAQAVPAMTPSPSPLPSRTPLPQSQTTMRRVSLPPAVPPPTLGLAAGGPTDEVTLTRLAAQARVGQRDFVGADRILRARPISARRDPELDGLGLWVRAHLESDLEGLIQAFDDLLLTDTTGEHALYYRGLILKHAGQRKAALRDFVSVVKRNPKHSGALSEIKDLRGTTED